MSVLILHGTWVPPGKGGNGPDGWFFVWAERVPAGRRGRKPTGGPKEGAPHPFQARPEEVRSAIVALSPALARRSERAVWRLVRVQTRLPSRDGGPLRSPEAAQVAVLEDGSREAPNGSLRSLTWQLRGVALDPVRAMLLLASLPLHGPPGIASLRLGSDLRYWGAVAKLVLDLLARERFVPALERVGSSFEARWRAVLDDPGDAARIAILERSQPPAARTLPLGENEAPTAGALLESFVDAHVDALIREWLGPESPRRAPREQSGNAVRAWLDALQRSERSVRASASDLERLASRLAQWRAPLVTPASSSSFRTCFRLEAPVTSDRPAAGRTADEPDPAAAFGQPDPPWGEAPWTLRIFLQATDDPRILVPAEQVWSTESDTLVAQNRRFDQPRERLLTELARASRWFGPLERCLAEPRPLTCRLSLGEAYTFLRESAWLLEENGFGVFVPDWWDRGGPRGKLGLRLRLRPAGDGRNGHSGLGRQALVEYDWRLAIGDPSAEQSAARQPVELTEAEFRRLTALKVPLVCVRGQWIELRPDKIEQAITFWDRQIHTAEMATSEALPLALGVEEVGGLPILDVEAEGWLTRVLDGADGGAKLAPLPTPPGFRGKLRPYQERGVGWLTFLSERGLGACLADDMGLGKTVEYIAFLLHRRGAAAGERDQERGRPGPALLICPTSVVGNWRHELERFAPELRVLVHHGPTRLSGPGFAAVAREHDLVISSYALVHRDRGTLERVEWDGVVLDEAQNVKNPATLQAQAVRGLPARYRFALTGTPIENRLAELWSIVDFLNPGYLGSQRGFDQRFAMPIERWQDRERAEQLRRLVGPLVLRRLKSDPTIIRDLPEKLEMKVFCTLTPEQASLYQAVVDDMLRRIEASEGMQRRGLVLAALTRLKQVCNHPVHVLADGSPLAGRSGKLERLQEMLEEVLEEGDRALVFTQFAAFGGQLRDYFQERFGREVLFLHGGVPAEQRAALVHRFQERDDGPPIFVLSLRAGGVGLNLTGASHVFHFDRWWNPAVEDQATDRAFRIGQRRNVQVHKLICAGTLEEKIDALLESKKALAEQVIGSGEAWLTELSTAELRDLLALRSSAVVE